MSPVHTIDFPRASFKDFEVIPGHNAFERAHVFAEFTQYMEASGQMNYRFITASGSGPEVLVSSPFSGEPQKCVSLVSNDYLNFTRHPKVIAAAIAGIEKYGTGAGASPLIGGNHEYHVKLEEKLCSFFGRSSGSCILYTTGYTANSASLLALLKNEDCAIVDMAVHASVYEGLYETNVRRFPHNSLTHLERTLSDISNKYATRIVIVDGVYSQDGDLALMDQIYDLTKKYGAYLMVDDAHGIGVLGETGRGAIEVFNLLDRVDIISGTLSKSFGHIGGFILSTPEIANYLKFQSRQHVFSSTATPASAGLLKAIDLIDEEPEWRTQLMENVAYYKKGLLSIGFDIGNTESPIIPIKIGDPHRTGDAARLLLKAGVYANAIVYPGVSKKNARIRTSLMATHTRAQLDHVLNAFDDINNKLHIARK